MTKVGIESKFKCVQKVFSTTIVLPTPPSYLIALSLCGAWIWLADPLVTGRKSKTLSVLTPSVGCRGVRTGLIRRSCISHFTHTTQRANAITSSTRGSTIWVKICRNTHNSAFFALGNSSFLQPIPAVSSSQFRVSILNDAIRFLEVTARHWMQQRCFKPEREYVWACTCGGVVHGAGQQEVEVLLVSSLLLEPRLQHHLHGQHVVLHLLQVNLGSQHQTVCWRHRERQSVSQASKLTGNVLHFSVRQRRELFKIENQLVVVW